MKFNYLTDIKLIKPGTRRKEIFNNYDHVSFLLQSVVPIIKLKLQIIKLYLYY